MTSGRPLLHLKEDTTASLVAVSPFPPTTLVDVMTRNNLYAAITALVLVAGAPLAASAADPANIPFDGPRPSSLNSIPATSEPVAAPQYNTAAPSTFGWVEMPSASPFDGPRPSSAH